MSEVQASTKRCPFCAEEVLEAAVKCKHCGSAMPAPPSPAAQPADPVYSVRPAIVWGAVAVVGTFCVILYGVASPGPIAASVNKLPPTPSAASPSSPPLPTSKAAETQAAPFDVAGCKQKRARDLSEAKALVGELRSIERAAAGVDRQGGGCFDNSLTYMRKVDALKPRVEVLRSFPILFGPLMGAWGSMRTCSLSCGASAMKEWVGGKCSQADWSLEQLDSTLPSLLADKTACEEN